MSKLQKLRRHPEQFFADSRHRLVRASGRWLAPLVDQPLVRALLLDPGETLATSNLPVVSALAQRYESAAARRRLDLIESCGNPLVSVVMAAYEAEDTIGDAIASVLEQSHSRIELIVVDDCSADRTREIAVARARIDSRVTVVATPENSGAALARNVGLARATGELACFQDADDRSHPQRIERQLEPMLRDPSLVVCLGYARREDADGRAVAVNGRRVARAVTSMLFRRQPVLDRIGYFRAMPISEDTEYLERMVAAFGDRAAALVEKTLLFQRFSPSSLMFADGSIERVTAHEVRHRRSAAAEEAMAAARASIDRIRRGEESPYVDANG